MERFFGPMDEEWRLATFMPRVDLAETDDRFEVMVEIPGLRPDEFSIDVRQHELWITGEKKKEKEEKGKTFHRIERHYGKFRRVIPLPGDVDEEKVTAEYKDGILTIAAPKVEKAKAKHVEVKT
jgi:HSP20 family protein